MDDTERIYQLSIRVLLMLASMTVVPRLIFRLMLDGRVPLRVKLMIPAILAYLVLPFDIIPDIVPVLGYIDDLVVVIVSLVLFLGMVPKGLLSEYTRGSRKRPRNSGSRPGRTVIDGQYRIVKDDKE